MDLSRLKVEDIMIREFIAAKPDDMVRKGIGGLPVVENTSLVGMVTQSCIINALSRCL